MIDEATTIVAPRSHAPSSAVHQRSKFFVGMAIAMLVIVLAAFTPTFYLKGFFDRPAVPAYVYLHGAAMTGWYAWFLLQTSLVATRHVAIHRQFGIIGALIGLTVVVTSTAVTMPLESRTDAIFGGNIVYAGVVIWASIARIIEFSVLLGLALHFRRRPEYHKRLMVLVSICMMEPATGRLAAFFPPVANLGEYPLSFTFISALFAALFVYDIKTRGRPHITTVLGSMFIVAGIVNSLTLARIEFMRQLIGIG